VTDIPPRPLRLAAAAYPVEHLADWDALAVKLSRWIGEAAGKGAEIAVLPEYGGMEAALAGPEKQASIAEWCALASDAAPRYAELCAALAQQHGLTLLSGSLPVRQGGTFVNRAYLCAPDAAPVPQDKQMPTPWERRETPIEPGQPIAALDTECGRLATLICYDAEFPQLARALAPDILLVPSSTERISGNERVRIGARARALEEQCVAVHAPLLGAVPFCEIVDANHGRAGIFGPPDTGFPDDGILAQTELDAPGWAVAEVPRGVISHARANGRVTPRADAPASADRAARATSRRL